ncbi:uncharacterized protein FFB20_00428 [Fusarium fujikuroi]|nr:uncharacterized protein FFB20_00428 [Fusarium fujikuroi]SCN88454.1 uncharacterized protein FFM5_04415 [Fusarium fujikuroi]SCO04739.1 uncharacterized protein FFC1_09737 [Fusarium fujikuroi]SCO36044.1 uncharacterized protein FFNC_05009 [Fusarium fujikuroi]SCO36950.1 uncharacterized protein FFMR_04444 [Fusarium fujikuroi]
MGWMRWGRRIIERWLWFAVAVAVAQFGYNCTCNCNQSINPAAVKARADSNIKVDARLTD